MHDLPKNWSNVFLPIPTPGSGMGYFSQHPFVNCMMPYRVFLFFFKAYFFHDSFFYSGQRKAWQFHRGRSRTSSIA